MRRIRMNKKDKKEYDGKEWIGWMRMKRIDENEEVAWIGWIRKNKTAENK